MFPQPLTMNKLMPRQLLLESFGLIGFDMCLEILSHLEFEDIITLPSVSYFFYLIMIRKFSCTTLCILKASENPRDFFSEIKNFQRVNRELMRPFLYSQIEFVNPGQPCEAKSPILGLFTTIDEVPEEIDTLQLRYIENYEKDALSFRDPICYEMLRDRNLTCDGFLDSLKSLSHNQKLPNLMSLMIGNKGIDLLTLEECSTNLQLTKLNIGRSQTFDRFNGYRLDGDKYYPLSSLQELVATMGHKSCGVDLPEFKILKKFILHIKKMNDPIKNSFCPKMHFNANRHKELENWQTFFELETFTSKIKFGLPKEPCSLIVFICNATPRQATFTVYGTEDDNGVFIPGNNNWVSNLRYVKIRRNFRWYVEISKGEFVKSFFNRTQRKIAMEYFDVKTEDDDSEIDLSFIKSDEVTIQEMKLLEMTSHGVI